MVATAAEARRAERQAHVHVVRPSSSLGSCEARASRRSTRAGTCSTTISPARSRHSPPSSSRSPSDRRRGRSGPARRTSPACTCTGSVTCSRSPARRRRRSPTRPDRSRLGGRPCASPIRRRVGRRARVVLEDRGALPRDLDAREPGPGGAAITRQRRPDPYPSVRPHPHDHPRRLPLWGDLAGPREQWAPADRAAPKRRRAFITSSQPVPRCSRGAGGTVMTIATTQATERR